MERVNGTLVPVIQANMEKKRTWDRKILDVERQLNNAYNKTIGDTPFHVLFRYLPSYSDGVLCHAISIGKWENTQELQKQVRDKIEHEHKQWKIRYDGKHAKPIHYTVGEIVFIKRLPEHAGDSTKLQPKYRRPLVITEAYPNDTYQVSALRSEEGRHYTTRVHVSLIKGYHLPEDTEEPTHSAYENQQPSVEDEVKNDGEDNDDQQSMRKQSTIEEHSHDEKRPHRIRRTPGWTKDYEM